MKRRTWLVCAVLVLIAAPARGQVRVGGFADIGVTTFAADDSFANVLGSNQGIVVGGGVEARHPSGVFGNVRISRFRADGERVFLFEGQRFPLGVPMTVTVTPVVFTGGYRLQRWARLVPYAGAGIALHRYTESSEAADDEENVSESFTGYHLVGGLEYRLSRLFAAAGEVEWATVPNALGSDPRGVAASFDEHDLGGVSIRVKIVVGR
jgi:opacity protein-like surface antigen